VAVAAAEHEGLDARKIIAVTAEAFNSRLCGHRLLVSTLQKLKRN
jgi:hypothetical protein